LKHLRKIIGILILALSLSCLQPSHSDEQENPVPPKPGLGSLLKLTFQINPLSQTVSLKSQAGPGSERVGELSAALEPFQGSPEGYLFAEGVVFIFLKLEGTGLKKDLVNIKVQITDLGSDSVKPRDVIMLTGGTEVIYLISGFSQKGLPYYDYGDFYAVDRARIFNSGSPSSWLWCLAFDLGKLDHPVEIKANVQAELPVPRNSHAKITIQPYLNNVKTDSVTVLWETDQESDSVVYYGARGSRLEKSIEGSTERYQDAGLSDPLKPPRFNLFRHQVILRGLKPGRIYDYQIRSCKNPSPVYQFRTLAEKPASFRFAVIGDTRTNDQAHQDLINRMTQFDIDFYIHLGDFGDNFETEMRRNFFRIEQPLASFVPIFPLHGNHESELWYKEYFALPRNSSEPALNELCYYFSYQGSYFIFVDSSQQMTPDSPAYLWLQSALSKAYADPARNFTFIFSHSPYYSGYNHFYPAGPELLQYLAPLFRNYDVSAGFGGHIHLYERMDVSGKPFLVSGCGGAPFYMEGENPDPFLLSQEIFYSGETVESKVQEWRYHFLLVDVGADDFEISAYDKDGVLFDQVLYHK